MLPIKSIIFFSSYFIAYPFLGLELLVFLYFYLYNAIFCQYYGDFRISGSSRFPSAVFTLQFRFPFYIRQSGLTYPGNAPKPSELLSFYIIQNILYFQYKSDFFTLYFVVLIVNNISIKEIDEILIIGTQIKKTNIF